MTFMEDLANFKLFSTVTDLVVNKVFGIQDGGSVSNELDQSAGILSKIKMFLFAFLAVSFLIGITIILYFLSSKIPV